MPHLIRGDLVVSPCGAIGTVQRVARGRARVAYHRPHWTGWVVVDHTVRLCQAILPGGRALPLDGRSNRDTALRDTLCALRAQFQTALF